MDNIFFDVKKLKYLGENCIIGKSVRIRNPERCYIGDNTIIDDFTYVSCELQTGKYCHIASNVTLSGGKSKLTLGNSVGISAGSTVFCASSDYVNVCLDMPSFPKDISFGGVSKDINIGSFILVGAQSCILPGVTLPDGFSCGAYSLIKDNVYEAWSLYVMQANKLVKLKDRPKTAVMETELYKETYK